MNNKKTSKFAIRRAKETKLGRFLCRLAGEENGQAMMEYVIIAVVVAAAAALAFIYFGKTTTTQVNAMSSAVAAKPTEAANTATANQAKQPQYQTFAGATADKFSVTGAGEGQNDKVGGETATAQ